MRGWIDAWDVHAGRKESEPVTRSRLLAFAVVAWNVVACSSAGDAGTMESIDAAVGAACANLSDNPSCPTAPGGHCLGTQCDLAALPAGQPCRGSAMCTMTVDPCKPLSIDSPTSGYGCACVSGHWACDDCAASGAECADAGAD